MPKRQKEQIGEEPLKVKLEGPDPKLPKIKGVGYFVKNPHLHQLLEEGTAAWIDTLPKCKTLGEGLAFLTEGAKYKLLSENSGSLESWIASWVPPNILQHLYGGIDRWRDSPTESEVEAGLKGELHSHGEYPLTISEGTESFKLIFKVKPRTSRFGNYTTQFSIGKGRTWFHIVNYYEHTELASNLIKTNKGGLTKQSLIDYDKALQELGLFLPLENPGLNFFARNMLQSKAYKALLKMEGIDSAVLKCAKNVWGLGRFEEFKEGTLYSPNGINRLDIKSAFPYQASEQQHPGPKWTSWRGYGPSDEIWKDLSWIWNDNVAYIFAIITEDTGNEVYASPKRQRIEVIGRENLVIFPKGYIPKERPIILMQHQLKARLLRYGAHWKDHIQILGGFVGFIKHIYKAMKPAMEEFYILRAANKLLGKTIDTRIGGNFAGTYKELVDDGSKLGTYSLTTLPTNCYIYAADIVDWVLSITDIINMSVRPENLLSNSVDGATILGKPPKLELPGSGMGSLKSTLHSRWTGYTDHFMEFDGDHQWEDRLKDGLLWIPRRGIPTLNKYLGRPGPPETLLRMYEADLEAYRRTTQKEAYIKIRVGPSKRKSRTKEGFNVLKDFEDTDCLDISEALELSKEPLLSDDKAAILIDEGGDNGEYPLGTP